MGIGNLVGFLVGVVKNGGGVFLFMYVIFVFVICLFVMFVEMLVGWYVKKDFLGVYSVIS